MADDGCQKCGVPLIVPKAITVKNSGTLQKILVCQSCAKQHSDGYAKRSNASYRSIPRIASVRKRKMGHQ